MSYRVGIKCVPTLHGFKDAIRLKYMSGFNTATSANMMRVGREAFKGYINLAHESLDTYMRVAFLDHYPEVVKEMEFILKLSGR